MSPTPETIPFGPSSNPLVGQWYPAQGHMQAAMVLHGATGVPQRFYRHFAAWAAERGIGTLTYDYRDFGASLRGPIRNSPASMADWAVADQDAAQRKLAELAPTGALWVLGHSLGGLGVAFHTYPARVSRIITLGSGMTHHWDHPWSYLPKVLAFWFLLGPLATAVTGYLPGRRLGLGADLPAGVYWQWRRWCTRRGFFASDIGRSLPQPDFDAPHPPLELCVATDDVVVPPVAVQRYAAHFAPSRTQLRMFDPGTYGLKHLGHVSFLGAGLGAGNEAAWDDLLLQQTAQVAAAPLRQAR
ncbi:alpha/beta hydrolase family protein [Tritonibacter mobilis]|uniref:alpha/beta hydrolase family protein n=1 Tax=Tritonibacter mobilis TaxID=379347 RepID=UPI0008068B78|nr:alpha/beta fold hydrolase [Tritonibacter mobilis]